MVMGPNASEKPHRRRPKSVTYSFLHFPWLLVTARTDPLTDKDKENAQQKKMERLQAENAKMKKKLKASTSAKGQTQYSV
jgi:alpha-beta hydrolase superfamily lysophospholipase